MEFPQEIMTTIMGYIPHPYRRPSHLDALNTCAKYADFVIDQALYHEDGETPEWSDSFIAYTKWRREL